eukprot:m.53829 g.53829  ORF g.53829 m.53829 type:complete len:395 (+) comp18444_c0_seq1:105-1289(+)
MAQQQDTTSKNPLLVPTAGLSTSKVAELASPKALARAKTHLGSSKSWPQTTAGPGYTSPDPNKNPFFYSFNHVYVPYANGDCHSGQVSQPSASTWGFYFSGHLNFVAFIDHLLNTTTIANADVILLTGGSAGGFGTFFNVDYLASRFPNAKVKGSPVAGWFFPGDTDNDQPSWAPPSDWPHWEQGQTDGPMHNSSVQELWNAYIQPGCQADLGKYAWRCASVHTMYPYLKSPLFVQENQFDTNQIQTQLALPKDDYNDKAFAYIAYFGFAMGNSTTQVYKNTSKHDGLFLPKCFDHGGGIGATGNTKINNYNSSELLNDWFFEYNKLPHVVVDTCAGSLPCNPTCDEVNYCLNKLEDLCGYPLPSRSQCLQCAEQHKSELAKVHCTESEVAKAC